MDNLTHTLVGAALAETGLKRWTPLATTTLILGANFPDIDIVVGFNKLAYLEHHRGITHAIVGIPILSFLLAGLIYTGSRWWRRDAERKQAKFGSLFVLSLLSMSTHPLLDFTNAYGWRPFLPWNHQWYYGDIAFVVDPWLWVSLSGTLMLATASTRIRLIGWSMLFAVMALPVIFFGGITWGGKIAWLIVVAMFFAWRSIFKVKENTARWLMCGVIVAILVYFGALTWLQQDAVRAVQNVATTFVESGEEITDVDAMPTPANPFLWRTVISTDKAFYFNDLVPIFLRISPSDPPRPARYERTFGDATAVAAAVREPELQAFLRFARFPVIEARRKPDQTIEVEARDVRFGFTSSTSSTFHISLRFDAQMRRLVE